MFYTDSQKLARGLNSSHHLLLATFPQLPAHFPTPPSGLYGINSQKNYLHLSLCLRFLGEPNLALDCICNSQEMVNLVEVKQNTGENRESEAGQVGWGDPEAPPVPTEGSGFV